ncbi:fucose 4-O-acetylase-like acetyltransferase [Salana multivorans]|uniref:Fucose 4-O-acetylase-like acetyltransferase n=1 Tax=Salana multivorans TaxID=120377 RepID=A0A3N2DD51_9MICO|nr:acyltransferase [Salana multivorans]ROR97725.1 fucose 4-O-acetylase-like acetyltransferase [Salana multivorans]
MVSTSAERGVEASPTPAQAPARRRLVNWDLLRALTMFLVVVTHMAAYVPWIRDFNPHGSVVAFAIICDPVFFALSGYFGIRPLKTSLTTYYYKKLSTIVLPLALYSVVLYAYVTRLHGMSLPGYLQHTAGLLSGGWWFIPALIPFLILAPFLYKALSALSDRSVVIVSRIVVIMTCWGILNNVVGWLSRQTGIESLSTLSAIGTRILPTSLIPGSNYFLFFCLGYFYTRLDGIMSDRQRRAAIWIGALAWLSDVLFATFGIDRVDPSYFWVFSTIAVFFVFSRVRVEGRLAGRIITWTAERSYSIYLFQYTTIAIVTGLVYDRLLLGDVAAYPGLVRLLIWVLTTVGAYLLALAAASVLDVVALKPLQRQFDRLTVARAA